LLYGGKKGGTEGMLSNCDCCANYVYDEEYECYTCMVDLDEDEMAKFVTGAFQDCPYYRNGDEYNVVRHQM
jgi:hypothetical protein